ncbi:hypothetical protein [Lonepinella sp. BR2904]|uniref:hypothetical protein n=1 Tax=Lonepinella sp. BR2904 TaxID=3434551 RepID=UPI003F6E2146
MKLFSVKYEYANQFSDGAFHFVSAENAKEAEQKAIDYILNLKGAPIKILDIHEVENYVA